MKRTFFIAAVNGLLSFSIIACTTPKKSEWGAVAGQKKAEFQGMNLRPATQHGGRHGDGFRTEAFGLGVDKEIIGTDRKYQEPRKAGFRVRDIQERDRVVGPDRKIDGLQHCLYDNLDRGFYEGLCK
ncbi:hypothetical protein DUT91_23510 [Phyllobacterium salinisoli]|uniref:Lipoprotein n=1 Tax=Phyllobacterium salinisoli TaxID=1899321 RepID=A0A368JYL0_9HYPH|nr:hypothetical protein [Phyllobacterium salinisoli]RCS21535.1 hypothetical protein DUT91_23510 [Phyllobacterium salinisoli]